MTHRGLSLRRVIFLCRDVVGIFYSLIVLAILVVLRTENANSAIVTYYQNVDILTIYFTTTNKLKKLSLPSRPHRSTRVVYGDVYKTKQNPGLRRHLNIHKK